MKNVSHKYINHVARLFYLYELIYQYPSLKTESLTPIQTVTALKTKEVICEEVAKPPCIKPDL